MKAVNEIRLMALNYAEKNKRPLKAVEDYTSGYNQCISDVNKITLNGFKELSKIIIEHRIKVYSSEFYDPNMSMGRHREVEDNQKRLRELLDEITNIEVL